MTSIAASLVYVVKSRLFHVNTRFQKSYDTEQIALLLNEVWIGTHATFSKKTVTFGEKREPRSASSAALSICKDCGRVFVTFVSHML